MPAPAQRIRQRAGPPAAAPIGPQQPCNPVAGKLNGPFVGRQVRHKPAAPGRTKAQGREHLLSAAGRQAAHQACPIEHPRRYRILLKLGKRVRVGPPQRLPGGAGNVEPATERSYVDSISLRYKLAMNPRGGSG